jgi:tripartite-type tricarboxylate transporter receptor subunit TctC
MTHATVTLATAARARLPSRWRWMLGLASLAASIAAAAAEPADAYPSRPVRIVVPYAAGGPADAIARRFADQLARRLGQPFVLEFRSGAGGTLGNDAAAKSAPDGHTLLFTTGETLVNNSVLQRKLPYDARRDLSLISVIGTLPLVFATHAAVPANDIAAFVAHAKAQPGGVSYGSVGEGGLFHIAAEMLLNRRFGLAAAHVPYRGLAPLTQDLAGGQIAASFGVASAFAPFAENGRLRILGVGSPQRLPMFPGAMTFAEQGLDDEVFKQRIWLAVLAPAGTPRRIVERLNAEITHALEEPEVVAVLAQTGFEAMRTTPAQAQAYFERDMATVPRLLRELGIEPQ